MPRPLTVLVVLAALSLSGCSVAAAPEPDRPGVPGLLAPRGEGLVGAAPDDLALVPPATQPVGAQIPAVGTCTAPVADVAEYLNSPGLGDVVDCSAGYGGVVVGVEGFTPADLAIDPSGDGYETLEDWGSPASIAWLEGLATPGCRAQIDAVQGHALAMGEGIRRVWALQPVVQMPSRDQWGSGERWAACLLLGPESRTIPGDVDVLSLAADQPLPPSLQACSTSVGRATTCVRGAATQNFLDLVLPADRVVPSGGPFPEDVDSDLSITCRAVLRWLDPDLAGADWADVDVYGVTDPLDNTVETGSTVVVARCRLVNENVGAGVQEFLG